MELARAVEHHRVRAVLRHHPLDRRRGPLHGLIPADAPFLARRAVPGQRIQQPGLGVDRRREQRSLRAQLTTVRGVIAVAAHLRDDAVAGADAHPAADPVVGADRSSPAVAGGEREPRHRRPPPRPPPHAGAARPPRGALRRGALHARGDPRRARPTPPRWPAGRPRPGDRRRRLSAPSRTSPSTRVRTPSRPISPRRCWPQAWGQPDTWMRSGRSSS